MEMENLPPQDAERARVYRAFFEEGRLKALPIKRKKRLLVLRVFAKLFEKGSSYPEKEVSARIGALFPDFCTIRRELVDFGFMARDAQGYWRLQEDDWLPEV